MVARGTDGIRGRLQQRFALRLIAELGGQRFTSALFSALAEGPHPLEREREGGRLHVSSIGRWGPDLK